MRCRGIVGSVVLALTAVGCSLQESPHVGEISKAMKLVDRGVAYLRTGELNRAEAAFSVAYEVGKVSAALDGLGSVAYLRGENRKAERLFWRAYNEDPEYHRSLGNLALLYEKEGNYSEALTMYRRAIKENPDDYRIRANYASFLAQHVEKGRMPYEAEFELMKAESLADHPIIRHNKKVLAEGRYR
ncbi:MAG: tetratricopeptide repeat protein [Candidatus Dadabacteria bacterium]|nr:MAG: tetratricopeptide repeat protein [Candidatus Dadabacteria bacterium]